MHCLWKELALERMIGKVFKAHEEQMLGHIRRVGFQWRFKWALVENWTSGNSMI